MLTLLIAYLTGALAYGIRDAEDEVYINPDLRIGLLAALTNGLLWPWAAIQSVARSVESLREERSDDID